MERLLTNRAIHTDSTLDVTTLAAEAGVARRLVRKQPIPFPVQHREHRVPRQRLLAEPVHIIEQITLPLSRPSVINRSRRSRCPCTDSPGTIKEAHDRHAMKHTSHLDDPLDLPPQVAGR